MGEMRRSYWDWAPLGCWLGMEDEDEDKRPAQAKKFVAEQSPYGGERRCPEIRDVAVGLGGANVQVQVYDFTELCLRTTQN